MSRDGCAPTSSPQASAPKWRLLERRRHILPDGSGGILDPKNRINHVKAGGFYGNMWGYHDVTDPSDRAMEPPVCWITNKFDRSPAELVRVTSDAWGPLKGSLSTSRTAWVSYSSSHTRRGSVMQGGCAPCRFPRCQPA